MKRASKGALRGVAGEDFIGKTSFAEEFEFVDNGIDHLFLKVIAVNIGSSEPHEAGEGLLGVLPICHDVGLPACPSGS